MAFTPITLVIKTRVFELCNGKYQNLSDLARAMGLSVSQVYRVREGKRRINQKFIIGAKKAFPSYKLEELFYLDAGDIIVNVTKEAAATRHNHIIKRFTADKKPVQV